MILAAGGFQGNQEMMAQYIGRDAHKIPTVAEGGLFNKGEAIRMAFELVRKVQDNLIPSMQNLSILE